MPTVSEAGVQPVEIVDPTYGTLGPFVTAGANREGLWSIDDSVPVPSGRATAKFQQPPYNITLPCWILWAAGLAGLFGQMHVRTNVEML